MTYILPPGHARIPCRAMGGARLHRPGRRAGPVHAASVLALRVSINAGGGLLHRGCRGGAGPTRPTSNLRYGSGEPVHIDRRHRVAGGAQNQDRRGRKRRPARQLLRRTARATIKYEEVSLHASGSVSEARASIGRWLSFYSGRRPHESLDRKTPDQACSNPLTPEMAAASSTRKSTQERPESVQINQTTSDDVPAMVRHAVIGADARGIGQCGNRLRLSSARRCGPDLERYDAPTAGPDPTAVRSWSTVKARASRSRSARASWGS